MLSELTFCDGSRQWNTYTAEVVQEYRHDLDVEVISVSCRHGDIRRCEFPLKYCRPKISIIFQVVSLHPTCDGYLLTCDSTGIIRQ